ncbi:MAG: hypothetical protein KC486_09765, partial [Myxococcales bacterium]|nr:hypothetical protein [Myxococcales bacterium]
FAAGLACEPDVYAPSDVACGDMTCAEGQVCHAYQNSCLPIEYSCTAEHLGCVVAEEADAAAFAACIADAQTSCEFDPETQVITCHDVGDAGC